MRAAGVAPRGIMIASLVLLGAASRVVDVRAQETHYPFACCTQLYGYLPYAAWGYGGFIRVTAYEESTRAQVVDLVSGMPVADGIIGISSAMVVEIDPGTAFKVVADKPVTALMGTNGAGVCPGMSFVPSRGNDGREFVLDFPETSPGWGLPNQHFLTLFAWEDASVGVHDVITDTTYWSGTILSGGYEKLLLPECRCRITSSGTLTAEILSSYDSSSFILDADQDGCGTEFMFHVYSMGLEHGRHSFYEIHAFDDASVVVYDINDPFNPIVFDTLSLLPGDRCTRSFDLFDDVFRVESTGRISVTAGSYQTSIGGPGPEAAGDFCSSVPSLNGEGLSFKLGVHCPHWNFSGGGFWVVATENSTAVVVEADTLEIDRDEWAWVPQPDTGIIYYDIVSDRPVCVLTGSIGGDNDFDNIMTYLPGLAPGQIGIFERDLHDEGPNCGFSLLGVMPNPSRGLATVWYSVPEKGRVRLAIYDTAGRLVEVLVDRVQAAGIHEATFDARAYPCGVYLCRVRMGDRSDTEKLIQLP